MTSAMPLMPMPPMPMKWIAPIETERGSGRRSGLRGSWRQLLHQIGQALRGIGAAERSARPAARARKLVGSVENLARACRASFGTSRSRSCDDPGRARLLQHCGVGRLVVVHRVRIGHEDRGPADHRQLAQRRRAAARDHEMRLRHAARQIAEELRRPRLRCRWRDTPLSTISRSSGTALLHDSRRERKCPGKRAERGRHESRDSARAPWLPPKTSRSDRTVRSGRRVVACCKRRRFGAHRIAGEHDALGILRREAGEGKRRRDLRDARRDQPIDAAEHRILLMQQRAGCARARPRSSPAGSDSRRSRPRRAGCSDRSFASADTTPSAIDTERDDPAERRAAGEGRGRNGLDLGARETPCRNCGRGRRSSPRRGCRAASVRSASACAGKQMAAGSAGREDERARSPRAISSRQLRAAAASGRARSPWSAPPRTATSRHRR